MRPTAYGDESLRHRASPPAYLLGVSLCEDDGYAALVDDLSSLRRSARSKLHWRDAVPTVRRSIAQAISRANVRHLVVEASLMEHARPERARQQALMTLLLVLSTEYGIDDVVLESRSSVQDKVDRATIVTAQRSGMVAPTMRLSHAYGKTSASLWVPDQVLGIVGERDSGYLWPLIEARTRIVTIPVSSA